MSLDAILKAVQSIGDQQIREIEQNARDQTRLILSEAQAQAIKLRDEACQMVILPAFRERAKILHTAHLDAIRIIGTAREELTDTILGQVKGRLATFRNNHSYPEVLGLLFREALDELNVTCEQVGNYMVQADPLDKELIDQILKKLGFNLVVDYSLDCWGGVLIQSLDQKIVVVNTLEARLERATTYLRRYLANKFELAENAGETSPLVGVDST